MEFVFSKTTNFINAYPREYYCQNIINNYNKEFIVLMYNNLIKKNYCFNIIDYKCFKLLKYNYLNLRKLSSLSLIDKKSFIINYNNNCYKDNICKYMYKIYSRNRLYSHDNINKDLLIFNKFKYKINLSNDVYKNEFLKMENNYNNINKKTLYKKNYLIIKYKSYNSNNYKLFDNNADSLNLSLNKKNLNNKDYFKNNKIYFSDNSKDNMSKKLIKNNFLKNYRIINNNEKLIEKIVTKYRIKKFSKKTMLELISYAKISIYNYMIYNNSSINISLVLKELYYFILFFVTILSKNAYKKIILIITIMSNLKLKLKLIINWIVFSFFGKIFVLYSIYIILITLKNYFLSNYSDINIMLKDELINIIDKMLSIGFFILRYEHNNLLYNILEQYFSLLIVGIMYIISMRSFLNTIYFLYTRAFSKIESLNNQVETLFMSYFIGMFYYQTCIFVVFSLPKTYR